ncbi:MAG: hypothetical protein JKY65_26065, partial [Planctomycetes bacterium]|nr:hypothetical protein [Planctomycetota bacterium]
VVSLGVVSLGVVSLGVVSLGVVSLGVVSLGVLGLGVLGLGVVSLGVLGLGVLGLGVLSLGVVSLGVVGLGVVGLGVVSLCFLSLCVLSLGLVSLCFLRRAGAFEPDSICGGVNLCVRSALPALALGVRWSLRLGGRDHDTCQRALPLGGFGASPRQGSLLLQLLKAPLVAEDGQLAPHSASQKEAAQAKRAHQARGEVGLQGPP